MAGVAQIRLDREAWYPGEWVTGALLLHFTKTTEVTGLDAWLYGHETTMVKVKHGKHTSTYRESRPIVQQPLVAQQTQGPLLYPGVYEPGTYTLPFWAGLADGIPPSFEGAGGWFRGGFYYNVFANIQVPWASDPGSSVPLMVVLAPYAGVEGPIAASAPATYFTGGTGLELNVDQSDAPRDGVFTGTVEVKTTGKKRLRGVTVELTQQVAGQAQGRSGATRRAPLATQHFAAEDSPFGVPLPFELHVPPGAAPSYDGQIVQLRHAVRAEADMAFAVNPNADAPVKVT